MAYESRKLVSDDGPKGEAKRTNLAWTHIRSRSVLEFVNYCAFWLGAPQDRALRQQLYDIVFADGAKTVRWQNTTYTGPMLLDVYYGARREAAG